MALERIGPYRIVRLLGKGGMGTVYEGFHEAIERRVAIKVLHAELGRRSDIATRFINEARAVNRIDHPGLVQISDYGQLPDGMAYIVMEYLKGETVGQRIKRLNTRFPAMDVLRLGRQLCTALAAAHEKDIVHRDLKPDNIMIVPNPDVPGGEQIKILDFGIAKLAETESGQSEANTRADALLGTPRYMSPEQCRGSGGVDAKSDVYALGVIFFEMLAGQPPFPGSAHGELIVQHIMQEPPPLASMAEPGTSEALMQLVHRMLAKEKNQRPTMRQAAAELDRLGGHLSGVYGTLPAGMSMPGLPLPTPVPGGVTGPSSVPGMLAGPGYPSVTGTGSVPGLPSHPGFGSLAGIGSHPGVGSLPGAAAGAAPSTLGLSAGQLPPSPRRRFPLSVAIGGSLGALAVAVALFLSIKQPPPRTPLPPPRPVVQQKPEPPKPQVHWQITTQPEGAMVVRQRDGQALGLTPLSLTKPAGAGSEQVRLVLQGFVEVPLTLDLSRDASETVELRRKSGRDKRNKNSDANPKGNNKGYVPGDLTIVD